MCIEGIPFSSESHHGLAWKLSTFRKCNIFKKDLDRHTKVIYPSVSIFSLVSSPFGCSFQLTSSAFTSP